MTYVVTITDPGAEPVSISLEWTTEAPTEPGWYWAECEGVTKLVAPDGGDGVEVVGESGKFYVGYFSRWLGPIPVPPQDSVEEKARKGALARSEEYHRRIADGLEKGG